MTTCSAPAAETKSGPVRCGRGRFYVWASDLVREDEGEEDKGHEDEEGDERHAQALFARDGGRGVLGLGHELRLAQSRDHRLIEQHGERGVHAGLEGVEGQEIRYEQLLHGLARLTHVKRSDEPVPQQHCRNAEHAADDETEYGSLYCVVPVVDECSGYDQRTGGEHVHDKTPDARVTRREHFYERIHDGDAHAGHGAVDEGRYCYDDVLGVVLEPEHDGNAPNQHYDVSKSSHHREYGHFLCIHTARGRRAFLCSIHCSYTPFRKNQRPKGCLLRAQR